MRRELLQTKQYIQDNLKKLGNLLIDTFFLGIAFCVCLFFLAVLVFYGLIILIIFPFAFTKECIDQRKSKRRYPFHERISDRRTIN